MVIELTHQQVRPAGAGNTPGRVAEPRITRSDMNVLRHDVAICQISGVSGPPLHKTSGFPPSYPPIEDVVAQRRMVRAVLLLCGIPYRNVEDAVQMVTIAAWVAIRGGRFRPDPSVPPSVSLRTWLRGVMWRQATIILGRASHRHEIPVPDPLRFLADRGAVDPYPRLEARGALRLIGDMPEPHRHLLAALAEDQDLLDYAAEQSLTEDTVWKRTRWARAELAERLAGRGWRRG